MKQLMGLRSIDTCQVTSAIIATVVPAALLTFAGFAGVISIANP